MKMLHSAETMPASSCKPSMLPENEKERRVKTGFHNHSLKEIKFQCKMGLVSCLEKCAASVMICILFWPWLLREHGKRVLRNLKPCAKWKLSITNALQAAFVCQGLHISYKPSSRSVIVYKWLACTCITGLSSVQVGLVVLIVFFSPLPFFSTCVQMWMWRREWGGACHESLMFVNCGFSISLFPSFQKLVFPILSVPAACTG